MKYRPAPIHKDFFWMYFRRLWHIEEFEKEDKLIPGADTTLKFLKERNIIVGIITGRLVSQKISGRGTYEKIWR